MRYYSTGFLLHLWWMFSFCFPSLRFSYKYIRFERLSYIVFDDAGHIHLDKNTCLIILGNFYSCYSSINNLTTNQQPVDSTKISIWLRNPISGIMMSRLNRLVTVTFNELWMVGFKIDDGTDWWCGTVMVTLYSSSGDGVAVVMKEGVAGLSLN